MAAIPNLREELDRKAFETVQWLFSSLDQAKITVEQFSTGIDTIFMVVAGLADEQIVDLVTTADTFCPDEAVTIKRHFLKKNALVSVARQVGESSVHLIARVEGTVKTEKTTECDTPKDALAHVETVGRLMMKNGYTEI